MSTKQFKRIGRRLKSPYLIDKIELVDFLCDLRDTIKEKGKNPKIITEFSERELMKLSKNELIIEYDNIRQRVHSNAKLLFILFPDLKKSYLDKLAYGEVD